MSDDRSPFFAKRKTILLDLAMSHGLAQNMQDLEAILADRTVEIDPEDNPLSVARIEEVVRNESKSFETKEVLWILFNEEMANAFCDFVNAIGEEQQRRPPERVLH